MFRRPLCSCSCCQVLCFRVTQNFVKIVFLAYGGAILLIGLAGLLSIFGGHVNPRELCPA